MKIAGKHFGNHIDSSLDPEPEEPIGLEYVLSFVRQYGFEVCLFLHQGTDNELISAIKKYSPDFIFFEMYSRDVALAIKIAGLLRTSISSALIVVGGCHPTALPKLTLEESGGLFDVAIIGEGEVTARDLLLATENSSTLDSIENIAFWSGGEVKVNKKRKLISNLNDIPWPIRDPRFYELPGAGLYYPANSKLRFSPIIHSRGCKRNCFYCASRNIWGGKPRFRTAEDVVAEMNYQHEAYKINLCFIEDLSISISKRILNELCDVMIKRLDPGVNWAACANVGLEKSLLDRMKMAHCVCLAYGIESLNEDILKSQAKYQTLKTIEQTLIATAKAGIITYAFYQIGFEGETESSIIDGATGLSGLPIHRLRVAIATPFPGSPWYDSIRDKSRLDQDWSKWDSGHPVILDHNVSPEKLLNLRKEILYNFYNNPKYNIIKNEFLSHKGNEKYAESFDEHQKSIDFAKDK